jgi:hypothetical protein
MLPQSEIDRLDRMVAGREVSSYFTQLEGGMTCVVLQAFRLPPGMSVPTTDMLLRLPPGFPDAAPDMFWCDPPVRRSNGTDIDQSQVTESYLDRQWQRFSRHLNPGEWRPGIDSIDSFIVLIRKTLNQGLGLAA